MKIDDLERAAEVAKRHRKALTEYESAKNAECFNIKYGLGPQRCAPTSLLGDSAAFLTDSGSWGELAAEARTLVLRHLKRQVDIEVGELRKLGVDVFVIAD